MKTLMMVAASLSAALLMNVETADSTESLGYSTYWQDIPANARAMGMGGAFSGVLDGPEAARWNPAVPSDEGGWAATWSRAAEREMNVFLLNRWSGAVAFEGRGVRVSVIHDRVAVGPFGSSTAYQPESGREVTTYDTTNILSISGDVTSLFGGGRSGLLVAGLGLRRMVHGIDIDDPDEYYGDIEMVGLDLGVTAGRSHELGLGDTTLGWRLGAARLNGVSVFSDDGMDPESDLKLGGALRLGFGDGFRDGRLLQLLLAGDWTKSSSESNDDQDWERRLGAEALVMNLLALRIGSIDTKDSAFLAKSSWGLGLILDDLANGYSLRINYARAEIDEVFFYEKADQEYVGVTVFVRH